MTLEQIGAELAWARALGVRGDAEERLRGGRLWSRFEEAKLKCGDCVRAKRAEDASLELLKRLLG